MPGETSTANVRASPELSPSMDATCLPSQRSSQLRAVPSPPRRAGVMRMPYLVDGARGGSGGAGGDEGGSGGDGGDGCPTGCAPHTLEQTSEPEHSLWQLSAHTSFTPLERVKPGGGDQDTGGMPKVLAAEDACAKSSWLLHEHTLPSVTDRSMRGPNSTTI